MRYLKLIVIAFALIVIAACAAPANDDATTTTVNSKPASHPVEAKETLSAADHAACEAAGGTVRRAGMIGWEHCVMPFPDAGKACQDNSECQGQCRYTLPSQGPGPVTGKCQADSLPFGCYSEVKNGKATPMLCVD